MVSKGAAHGAAPSAGSPTRGRTQRLAAFGSGETVVLGNSTDLENQLLPHIFLTMLNTTTSAVSAAETCRAGVAARRALKDSTIRTILRKLEEKGYATHTVDGRTFVYRAADSQRNVAVAAAQQLIDRFCGGSVEELLVGLVDNQLLAPKQLQRLAEKIASRKEKKA